jgi:hypothetical protein
MSVGVKGLMGVEMNKYRTSQTHVPSQVRRGRGSERFIGCDF